MVSYLFPPADAERILAIKPLCDVQDKLLWDYNDNSAYSVKSGYWFLSNYPYNMYAPPSGPDDGLNLLKTRIWKIQTVPKIRMFLWRTLLGAFAVSERLVSRSILLDTTFKMFQFGVESICHVLFGCSVAIQMLFLADISVPIGGFSSFSLTQNISFLLDIIEQRKCQEMICHAIP